MHISKRVITQLEASDWFDRLLLLFGLLLFCSVVLYIIKKRTWDVGISWVAWITQTKKSSKGASTVITAITKTVLATTPTVESITEATTTTSILSNSDSSISSSLSESIIATVTTAGLSAITYTSPVISLIKDEL